MQYDTGLSNLSYVNKDFQSIYPELLDLVKKISYKWDPSISDESDPGVILLKLCAIVADKNNYNIDKNILECFPESVTQYHNARPLFQQLGYNMHWYLGATTDIAFKWIGERPVDFDVDSDFYTIPKFTMVSDNERGEIFTLTNDVILHLNGDVETVEAIQGSIRDFTINGNKLITSQQLDSQRRLYFPDYFVAENGIFITNVGQNNYTSWTQVDNLSVQQFGQFVYKFGISRDGQYCYLEFPEDVEDLFGEGINISYIITNGYEGNVASYVIDQFYNDVNIYDSSKNSNVTLNSDNVLITNNSAQNGKDPETIVDAYKNYKRTIGTFDTLVTKRDYENFLMTQDKISNCFVCDRVDDIQFSYKVVQTMDKLIRHLLKVEKHDEHTTYFSSSPYEDENSNYAEIKTPENKTISRITEGADISAVGIEKIVSVPYIGSFQLKLYALQYVANVNNSVAYNTTFKLLKNVDTNNGSVISDIINQLVGNNSESAINNIKCIQHDFIPLQPNRICLLKNKYPITIKIIPQYKLTTVQQEEIEKNISEAIYTNFNSSKLAFGEEINYDELFNVIERSDERIKAVVLDDLAYTTYAVYYDSKAQDYKEVAISDNFANAYINGVFYTEYDDEHEKYENKFIQLSDGRPVKAESNLFGVTMKNASIVSYSDSVLACQMDETTFGEKVGYSRGTYKFVYNGSWKLFKISDTGYNKKFSVSSSTSEEQVTTEEQVILKEYGIDYTLRPNTQSAYIYTVYDVKNAVYHTKSIIGDTTIWALYSDKINEFRTEIYAKCVLNGNTQLLFPDNEFAYNVNQQYESLDDKISRVSTNVDVHIANEKLVENEILTQFTIKVNDSPEFVRYIYNGDTLSDYNGDYEGLPYTKIIIHKDMWESYTAKTYFFVWDSDEQDDSGNIVLHNWKALPSTLTITKITDDSWEVPLIGNKSLEDLGVDYSGTKSSLTFSISLENDWDITCETETATVNSTTFVNNFKFSLHVDVKTRLNESTLYKCYGIYEVGKHNNEDITQFFIQKEVATSTNDTGTTYSVNIIADAHEYVVPGTFVMNYNNIHIYDKYGDGDLYAKTSYVSDEKLPITGKSIKNIDYKSGSISCAIPYIVDFDVSEYTQHSEFVDKDTSFIFNGSGWEANGTVVSVVPGVTISGFLTIENNDIIEVKYKSDNSSYTIKYIKHINEGSGEDKCQGTYKYYAPILKDVTSEYVSNTGSYTLKQNESINFSSENMINVEPFSNYVIYQYQLDKTIYADEEHLLGPNESIIFFYKPSDSDTQYTYHKLTQGKIIKPSQELSTDYNSVTNLTDKTCYLGNLLQAGKGIVPNTNITLGVNADGTPIIKTYNEYIKSLTNTVHNYLNPPDTITQIDVNSTLINDTTRYVSWVLNDDRLTPDGKYMLFDEGETSYTLRTGEYLIYANSSNTRIILLSSGTVISRDDSTQGSSYGKWALEKVDLSEINEYGYEGVKETAWWKISNTVLLTVTEMRYILLNAGVTVSTTVTSNSDSPLRYIVISHDGESFEPTVRIHDETSNINWKLSDLDIGYKEEGQEDSSISKLPITNEKYPWRANTIYSLDITNKNPQRLYCNQSIKLFKDDEDNPFKVYHGSTDERYTYILSNRDIEITGGEYVDVTVQDSMGEITYLELYRYNYVPKEGEYRDTSSETDTDYVDLALSSNISGWVPNKYYILGDTCFNNSGVDKKYYRCVESHQSTDVFVNSKWEEITHETKFSDAYYFKLPDGDYIIPFTHSASDVYNTYLSDASGEYYKAINGLDVLGDLSLPGTYYLKLSVNNNHSFLQLSSVIPCGTTRKFVIDGIYKYKINFEDKDKSKYKLTTEQFNNILTKVIELDIDSEFDYTYQVSESDKIRYPLESLSFLDNRHPYNKFTICQADTLNSSILITNKIK